MSPSKKWEGYSLQVSLGILHLPLAQAPPLPAPSATVFWGELCQGMCEGLEGAGISKHLSEVVPGVIVLFRPTVNLT